MKIQMLTAAVVAGCVLGCASLTQQGTLTIKGTVCSCTNTQVTVQEEGGKYYDIIQRTGSTIITGTCLAGQTVTVQCQSVDNQRKEGSCPKTAAKKLRRRLGNNEKKNPNYWCPRSTTAATTTLPVFAGFSAKTLE